MGSPGRVILAAAGFGLLLGTVAAASPAQPVPVAAGDYVRRGIDEDASPANDDAIANIGFIVGTDSVAVIDPGGSKGDGENLRAGIRAVTALPIKYVIMTHGHPDHIFGGIAFEADHPVFVGHARLPGMLAERGSFYRQQLAEIIGRGREGDYDIPTLLVKDHTEIDLGGRVLELDAYQAAHSDADLTILDRGTGTLWTGDLLFVDRVPSLDGSLTGWLRALERLKSIKAARAVPGHGPISVPWPGAEANEERYLLTLARDTRALIAKGGDIETAATTVARSERSRWTLFDDYNGRNATEAFKELEWE